MAAKPWFKVKPFGYGAWPATWRGWLAFAACFGLCVAWLETVVWARTAWFGGEPGAWDYLLMIAGLVIIYGGYTLLKIKKADGPWRWRWSE